MIGARRKRKTSCISPCMIVIVLCKSRSSASSPTRIVRLEEVLTRSVQEVAVQKSALLRLAYASHGPPPPHRLHLNINDVHSKLESHA